MMGLHVSLTATGEASTPPSAHILARSFCSSWKKQAAHPIRTVAKSDSIHNKQRQPGHAYLQSWSSQGTPSLSASILVPGQFFRKYVASARTSSASNCSTRRTGLRSIDRITSEFPGDQGITLRCPARNISCKVAFCYCASATNMLSWALLTRVADGLGFGPPTSDEHKKQSNHPSNNNALRNWTHKRFILSLIGVVRGAPFFPNIWNHQ